MKYTQLFDNRTIRLLEVIPTNVDNVVCRLHDYSLDDCPAYEALSYVWGPPVFDHSIVCDDHTLNITRSLYDILVLLQRANTGHLLWIDQICINQGDVIERARQVRLMGDIYGYAATVVCFLGQADEDTEVVWQLLLTLQEARPEGPVHLYEAMTSKLNNSPAPPSSSVARPRTARPTLPDAASKDWSVVQKFLLRPWFTRCWTYQEALLGSSCTMRCGAFEISFDSFPEAVKDLFNAGYGALMGRGHWHVSGIGLQRDFLQKSLGRPHMAYILSISRDRQAMNPRDKVYALLGVIHAPTAGLITSDYSLSIDEVYADAVRACIQGSRCLEILTHVEVRRYDDHTFPSWVPDWRYLESTRLALGIRTRNSSQYFKTTGSLTPLLLPTQDWRKLGVKGFLIAPITSFRDVKTALQLRNSSLSYNSLTSERWDTQAWFQMYRSAIDTLGIPNSCVKQREDLDVFTKHGLDAPIDNPPPHHCQLETAFRRTMTADLHPLSPGRVADKQYYTAFYSWQRQGFPEPIPPQVLLEHDSHVSDLMFQREFFIAGTEPDCYMGVALGTIRERDWVCILAGGDTPYVIRPRRKSPEQDVADVEEWEFIHDCYVHGVMNGEALQRLEDPSFEWRDFVLV